MNSTGPGGWWAAGGGEEEAYCSWVCGFQGDEESRTC